MKLLKTLGHGQGYLKAGFLGFQGSGKTFTSILLAIATRRAFKLDGPIAFIDTENASEYVAPLVKELTGVELVGVRTRRFDDLLAVGKECVECGISCLVADSMTHFWRSLCDSYLAGVNERRQKKGMGKRYSLEFQDWGQVKGQWANWTDFFLNSPLHIIICGRAGFEYDMSKNEETGKSELIKTGVKMKTEAEFGFEPSLLVQMEADQEPDPKRDGKFRQIRTATVLKDRFAVIDAQVTHFPGLGDHKAELEAAWAAFSPHVQKLIPGAHSTVDTVAKPLDVDDEGDVDWARERKARTILCEEIQGVLVSAIPGQGAEDKKRKADMMQAVFGTRSWTAVESTNSDRLREGLAKLRSTLEPKAPSPTSRPADSAQDLADAGFAPVAPTPTAPVQAPAPAPKAPEPTAKVAQTPDLTVVNGAIPEDTALKVVSVISPVVDQALTWLVNNKQLPFSITTELESLAGEHGLHLPMWLVESGWLKARIQQHLPEKTAAKIVRSPDAFRRAIAA